jgi:hypothetical protein
MSEAPLQRTALYEDHVKAGAKLVPFAGYEMPVQYPTGILTEQTDENPRGPLRCFPWARPFWSARSRHHRCAMESWSCRYRQLNLTNRYSQFLNSTGGSGRPHDHEVGLCEL